MYYYFLMRYTYFLEHINGGAGAEDVYICTCSAHTYVYTYTRNVGCV